MIDLVPILGEYTVMANGSPDMAWIVRALILLMCIYAVILVLINLVKGILR